MRSLSVLDLAAKNATDERCEQPEWWEKRNARQLYGQRVAQHLADLRADRIVPPLPAGRSGIEERVLRWAGEPVQRERKEATVRGGQLSASGFSTMSSMSSMSGSEIKSVLS